ncbi:uncharacterized protein LOC143253132 [Tachypleus tridentatus]|uniref:uncharacterized protein LOC143253132 n=1 Tax=Tachypleus tridentatus TaxID=6853 RepID=UPI003FCF0B46
MNQMKMNEVYMKNLKVMMISLMPGGMVVDWLMVEVMQMLLQVGVIFFSAQEIDLQFHDNSAGTSGNHVCVMCAVKNTSGIKETTLEYYTKTLPSNWSRAQFGAPSARNISASNVGQHAGRLTQQGPVLVLD